MGLILFSSCITSKKAYNYVATDPVVDGKELAIMSQKCAWLFPTKINPPVQSGKGVDSSVYNEAIENQNILLDQIIAAQNIIDSLTGDTSRPAITAGDSARIIRNYISKNKPKPIFIHDTTEVEVESTALLATVASLRGEINALRSENYNLSQDRDSAVQKAKDKSKTNTYLWVVLALLVAGNVYQVINRLR